MSDSVVWPLEPHTAGKHIVLRAYLNAWLPILGTTQGRVLFFDGFAGPGEYRDGEMGSPIIALDALKNHNARARMSAEIVFAFMEKNAARAAHLRTLVAPYEEGLPNSVKIHIGEEECATSLSALLDNIEGRGKQMAPAFVMLDPFGVSDTPMALVGRVLSHPKSEVYISMMWEWINRFKSRPAFERHLTGLFGTEEWKAGAGLTGHEAKVYFHDLYARQLRANGARYVTSFELLKNNRHVYTIFFATKHPKGMDLMKQAIWKADRTGNYQFIGRTGEQIDLDIAEAADFRPFANEIRQQFGGKEDIPVEEVTDWAMTDTTDYHSEHVKRALRHLEQERCLSARKRNQETRRRNTYPGGTLLTITAPG